MRYRELLLAATILSGMASAAHAMDGVVASIKPVHSLVAAVMGNTGRPKLIVDGAGSPHTYSLKPSQARMLEDAKLVFWIGHDLEAFLEKPLETLSGGAQVVALSKADGMKLLELREGGTFEAHDHGHEGHGDHDHDHDHEADHERAEHAGREHEEGHAHEHEAHDDHAEKHADHDHDGEDHGGHHHG
ncbi:MAG: zinc ABC transporter substrate-binding protein, partial [Rhodobiaceae bacterium]|nr:zinc ABC transporter substrate-binding protein [Rhodobiaceae bacterium]